MDKFMIKQVFNAALRNYGPNMTINASDKIHFRPPFAFI
jgi:hypothetical protein